MATTVASRKAKGRRLQKLVADKIGELLNLKVGKDEMIAPREMGQSGTDVRLIGPAKELFPFSVECKNQETWSLPAWIKQAQSNQEKNTNWLLVCQKNHMKPVVVMDMNIFFEIFENLLIKEKG
jgi:hypothetical protein